MKISEKMFKAYWQRNLILIGGLLTLWFTVSYGMVILFGEQMSRISIGNINLAFWFGQQGSILVFVGILVTYAMVMDRMNERLQQEALAYAQADMVGYQAHEDRKGAA